MSELLCLIYHNVVPDGTRSADLSPSVTSYFVTASAFGEQMKRVAQMATCFSLDNVEAFFEGRFSGEHSSRETSRPVHITFDDGWLGSVRYAGEILQLHGLRATLFVTTGLIGRPRFVGPDELRCLPRETFRLGSHGHSHRFLSDLPTAQLRRELQTSKTILEDIVGYEVAALSVPGGAVSERVVQLAAECGYRYVFTSRVGFNTLRTGPADIGRLAVKRSTSVAQFERWLRGNVWPERLRSQLTKVVRGILGQDRYAALRRRVLGESSDQRDMVDLYREGVASPSETTLDDEVEPAMGETACVGG